MNLGGKVVLFCSWQYSGYVSHVHQTEAAHTKNSVLCLHYKVALCTPDKHAFTGRAMTVVGQTGCTFACFCSRVFLIDLRIIFPSEACKTALTCIASGSWCQTCANKTSLDDDVQQGGVT